MTSEQIYDNYYLQRDIEYLQDILEHGRENHFKYNINNHEFWTKDARLFITEALQNLMIQLEDKRDELNCCRVVK